MNNVIKIPLQSPCTPGAFWHDFSRGSTVSSQDASEAKKPSKQKNSILKWLTLSLMSHWIAYTIFRYHDHDLSHRARFKLSLLFSGFMTWHFFLFFLVSCMVCTNPEMFDQNLFFFPFLHPETPVLLLFGYQSHFKAADPLHMKSWRDGIVFLVLWKLWCCLQFQCIQSFMWVMGVPHKWLIHTHICSYAT